MHAHTYASRVLRWFGSNGVFWLQLSSHAPSDTSKTNITVETYRCSLHFLEKIWVYCSSRKHRWRSVCVSVCVCVCVQIKRGRERERSGCEWQIFSPPFTTTANIASSKTTILSSSSGSFPSFLSPFLPFSLFHPLFLIMSIQHCVNHKLKANTHINIPNRIHSSPRGATDRSRQCDNTTSPLCMGQHPLHDTREQYELRITQPVEWKLMYHIHHFYWNSDEIISNHFDSLCLKSCLLEMMLLCDLLWPTVI